MIKTTLTCPECGGMIMMPEDNDNEFICKVGHRYSTGGFLVNQSSTLEATLWTAYRLLYDRQIFLQGLSEREKKEPRKSEFFKEQAAKALEDARDLRAIIEKEVSAFAEEKQRENTI